MSRIYYYKRILYGGRFTKLQKMKIKMKIFKVIIKKNGEYSDKVISKFVFRLNNIKDWILKVIIWR